MRTPFCFLILILSLLTVTNLYGQTVPKKKEPPREFTSHRGTRIQNQNEGAGGFCLLEIRTKKVGQGMYVDFVFTRELDPRRVSASQFTVDGEKIPSDTKFKFNKGGTIARIFVDRTELKSLQVEGVVSFFGAKLKAVTVENISADSTIRVYSDE